MSTTSRIELNQGICHGKPVIQGTRVLVSSLLGALRAGDSVATVLDDLPILSKSNSAIAESKGLLKGSISDPMDWQRKLRDEWET